MSIVRLLLFLVLAAAPVGEASGDGGGAGSAVARTILALYDGDDEPEPRNSRMLRFAALPLNHLGLVLRFHDLRHGLPSAEALEDVRGVLTWFDNDLMPDAEGYAAWATDQLRRGMRFVVLGDPGVATASRPAASEFFRFFGLRAPLRHRLVTYDLAVVHQDPELYGYERPLTPPFKPFPVYHPTGEPGYTVHLAVGSSDGATMPLAISGPHGVLVAAGYSHFLTETSGQRKWYVDPFALFSRAFATGGLPKPDATTVQGRRIYYSHVDGDGWHNASEFPGYANRRGGATAALLGEIFERYPDLPVTVAPIGADLDPAMAGSPEAVELARRVFALRHVEAGTHTYTHPFRWDFFARYDPARERAWLARKDNGAKASHRHGRQHPQDDHADDPPRAHFHVPFDVEREIGGSTGLIQAVAGKPVRLVQWSGDARPFAQALAAAAARGLGSINGGDSRFDPEFPSLLYVAPHADTTTGIVQPFASNSNENTYTGLWGRRFFGQRYLKATLANTETPVRLKPFNLYYHNYSGERVASIAALRELLDHARSQEIAPVTASHYAAIVQGFHTTRLIAVGENAWRIEDRGSLDTIRFDHATFLAIDFDRSRGVIGQRHHQGSLYVALDPAEKTALVALAPADHADLLVQAARPYIVSGRWLASEVAATSGSARYRARGFGKGEFTWWHPDASAAAITVTDEAGTVLWSGVAHRDVTGCLSFSADADAIDGVVITIQFQPGGRCASTSC